MSTEGRRIEVRGTVQGVGFRPWIFRLASDGGVTGRVRNDAAGVVIDAFGSPEALDGFAQRLRSEPPPAADIVAIDWHPIPPEPVDGFVIAGSTTADELRVSIPPDLATCGECLAEMLDPLNRRYRYPFTNCTHCGPRFTIARDVPYDRAVTTMEAFTMCDACQREYDDPADRRFHAQPNACPACGPTVALLARDGNAVECDDAIDGAAGALNRGAIVAIKGLGGFHLACDATNSDAIARLRELKHREEKPFAVMVADLRTAERLAWLTHEERTLLSSVARPIVLAHPRLRSPLSPLVAPDAPLVGLMLPYTPLHHLLLRSVPFPLVMTSGNITDEPIAFENADALERLAPLTDFFLVHDRAIDAYCDDSIARVIAGAPVLLRRSRGYVPKPVRVAPAFQTPVLACGALLKNTFCVGLGDSAHMGPHIGDLANMAAYDAYVAAIERMTTFLRLRPEVIAHDLHPDYLSTRYALSRTDAATIGVQHHHAHIVSVMAEHGLRGPVIGVAYDGTGHGTDGNSWGGEILLAALDRFERVATLRPLRLAGGDMAIHEPWRIALALTLDAFDSDVPGWLMARLRAMRPSQFDGVQQMLASHVHAPLAHGAGRYFDGIASLVLERPHAAFEGQLALAWNGIAQAGESGRYPFTLDRTSTPWSIDLRPAVRAIVQDIVLGESPGRVSARFHNTLVEATAETVDAIADERGSFPVALSGGCFQNPRLTEGLLDRLSPRLSVHINRRVPPGDGGIALGQAVVAAATIAKGR